ncbi:hypothetical protein NIES2119_22100 [[Phormidium ambiguum] IAM M-71]|uniref:Type I restriction modification DNA specificity domain-containing protein n=1 Tax=[Phormidium ambiguum] IAM M-71 TaxID=454136 RepID=A0A1U7IAZ4_9CYAN|nr:restriction endonuclease subunit S [Phormidium ambiguum]OKH33804.1 hypothetical protein NIES2119_22100 [Phormidium ambiguum IAM M-71]
MSEWKRLTLKQAGIILIDCDHKTPDAVNNGLPYVTIPQLKDGRIVLSDARLISEEDFEIWTRKAKPQTHDVVVSRRCNPGESAYVSDGLKFALGQNLVLLRSDNKIVLQPFLRWLVRSPAWWEEVKKFINVGAVFNSLKCTEIVEFKLPIPPIDEQESIVKLLSSLDDKIDNLRRQNETLEKIAQTLFKHWFIDFEFPNHDGKPYKSSGGAMVASELGDIPEGWRVGKLGDIGKIITGKTPSTENSELWGNDLYFITPTDFKNYGKYILNAERSISKSAISKFKQYIIPENSIVVTCIGSDMGKVVKTAISCITNQQINSLIPLSVFPFHEYIFSYLRNQYKWLRIIALGGSTMPIINKSTFSEINILLPNSSILIDFEATTSSLNKKIINNENQIQTLTKTRDTLLPKLMSGEIRVKEA